MNKENSIHNFHFVLTKKLKSKIVKLSKKLKMRKSAAALYILNRTIVILEKYQFDMSKKEDLHYKTINWDSDMHIFMDKKLYLKIKHISNSIGSFSIAITIRKLLDIYFRFLEKNNSNIEKVEMIFNRFYKMHVKKFGKTIKSWDKKEIETEQLADNFYYSLKYDDKFSIIGFNFNNSE